jgi:hypothetical protein
VSAAGYIIPRLAAVGQVPNDKIKFCRTCKARGHPHEAISFRKINDGRLKGDGDEYEFSTYQILNYSNDEPHEHRPYKKDVNLRVTTGEELEDGYSFGVAS